MQAVYSCPGPKPPAAAAAAAHLPLAAVPAAAGTMCSSPLPMRLRTTASEPLLSEPQRVDVEAEQQQNPQQPARRQPPVKAQQLAAMTAAHQRQQQQQQGAAPTRQGAKQPAKGKQLAAKGEKAAGEEGEGQKGERQRRLRGAQSLTALTALGTVALYGSVRGGISLFHHARRKFLTQVGAGRVAAGGGGKGRAGHLCAILFWRVVLTHRPFVCSAPTQPVAPATCPIPQLLHDLAAALNDMGVTWWLDFGSLLGIHRDGELIKHDNDVRLEGRLAAVVLPLKLLSCSAAWL